MCEGSISTDELGTTAKFGCYSINKSIRKLRPHTLIKMLIDLLGDNGTMTEQQYNEKLIKLNREEYLLEKTIKTPFRSGHCGAVMSLRPRKNLDGLINYNLDHVDYGENPDGSINMSMLWREAYQILKFVDLKRHTINLNIVFLL